jgi:hypothetical protein
MMTRQPYRRIGRILQGWRWVAVLRVGLLGGGDGGVGIAVARSHVRLAGTTLRVWASCCNCRVNMVGTPGPLHSGGEG